ncbi:type 4a pilus biogenesis protein PilO [Zoogloea sp.]|uniref:type 4a pilus biogenesis protein PilO n=1 Tax=Zoogloea sp. TaxID=49181 RepID=UPI00262678B9|nr:type 4a pilus biogenesis protein PilO [Zoogloea sp.]MDD3352883.1 type 4a pilus biogenesis protein PilO [Zoogloea sp.]
MSIKETLERLRTLDLEDLQREFRGLDPNDPGQWPLVPRVVALASIFFAIVLAGWWFDWQGQLEQLTVKESDELTLKEDWLNKKRQAINLAEYRRQLSEIDRQFGALLKQLPNSSEIESLLADINQAGLGRGLQFELFKPGAESSKDFYAELPIVVRVVGSYHDLGEFVSDVAKMPRIVTLNDIALEATKEGTLKFDATAVTYRYLDDEEVAQLRKAKAKEKGPK